MLIYRLGVTAALILCFGPSIVFAKDYPDDNIESVSCYQSGQLVFKTQNRLREFRPKSEMVLLAEVSVGQVQETVQKLYASDRGDIVCVVTNKK